MEDASKQEILDAINTFATSVDRRFDRVEADILILKTDVAVLKTDVAVLKTDVAVLKTDVGGLKTSMVTKDYLDEKLADFKAGLKDSATKAVRHVSRMAQMLYKGGLLTAEQVLEIRTD